MLVLATKQEDRKQFRARMFSAPKCWRWLFLIGRQLEVKHATLKPASSFRYKHCWSK